MIAGRIRQPMLVLLGVLVAAVIVWDSSYHFDRERVTQKIQHSSAQRNWSVFFWQDQVLNQSSFRYQQDFLAMLPLIEPEKILLSDLATSYYAASVLPVYVVNVHDHHRRKWIKQWSDFLDTRNACYLNKVGPRNAFEKFRTEIKKVKLALPFSYFLLNKDKQNKNLRTDCIGQRSKVLEIPLAQLGKLVFEGEYLNLYLLSEQ